MNTKVFLKIKESIILEFLDKDDNIYCLFSTLLYGIIGNYMVKGNTTQIYSNERILTYF